MDGEGEGEREGESACPACCTALALGDAEALRALVAALLWRCSLSPLVSHD
jgi:hypothetical protein